MERKVYSTIESLEEDIATAKIPSTWVQAPPEIYRKASPLNYSTLKNIEASPAKYQRRLRAPKRETPALTQGDCIHVAILEGPDVFDARFAVAPDVDRRTKGGKELYAAFEATSAGKKVISHDMMETTHSVLKSVWEDSFYRQFFDKGAKECSWFHYDLEYGLWIKARLDNWIEETRVIVDLKTTEDASPKSFQRDITTYRYFVQAAWYADIVEKVTGEPISAYVLVAVEKGEDCDVTSHFIDGDQLRWGREIYTRWLKTYNKCFSSGQWPGYDRKFHKYEVPDWFINSVIG